MSPSPFAEKHLQAKEKQWMLDAKELTTKVELKLVCEIKNQETNCIIPPKKTGWCNLIKKSSGWCITNQKNKHLEVAIKRLTFWAGKLKSPTNFFFHMKFLNPWKHICPGLVWDGAIIFQIQFAPRFVLRTNNGTSILKDEVSFGISCFLYPMLSQVIRFYQIESHNSP